MYWDSTLRKSDVLSMPDHPIAQSELTVFLKRLLETAPPSSSTPFLDTLIDAQALLNRLEPPDAKPRPTMSIAYLNLTVMAHNLLLSAGIQTLGELMSHNEYSLGKIPGMGRKSVKVILEALKPFGGTYTQSSCTGHQQSWKPLE